MFSHYCLHCKTNIFLKDQIPPILGKHTTFYSIAHSLSSAFPGQQVMTISYTIHFCSHFHTHQHCTHSSCLGLLPAPHLSHHSLSPSIPLLMEEEKNHPNNSTYFSNQTHLQFKVYLYLLLLGLTWGLLRVCCYR